VRVAHSTESRSRWTSPAAPPVGGISVDQGEIVEVVAFDESIGVFWSDQRRDRFHFALHRDADPDHVWTSEAPLSGTGLADDHISAQVVRAEQRDIPLVVVKTSLDDRGADGDRPLVFVLRRNGPDAWSTHQVATVDDHWTRPVLSVDTAGTVYAFGRVSGSVVLKTAQLDDLAFRPGPGTVVLGGSPTVYTDPTVPAQMVDSVCGIVLLASDSAGREYGHAEMAVNAPADPDRSGCDEGRAAPPAPTLASAAVHGDAVRLTWEPSSELTQWTPASDPAEARYTIFRDDVRIGSTTQTTFLDTPDDASTYTYAVRVQNRAGHASPLSDPVRVRVDGIGSDGPAGLPTAWLVVAAVVAAGCVAVGAYVHGRARVRRSAATAQAWFTESSVSLPMMPAPTGKHARRRVG
ncbi:MAG: hypothetical protein ACRDWY_14590, partial [Actinomycetes bacterium]